MIDVNLETLIDFRPDDVQNIVSGKLALKYAGRDIDAMKMVASSSHKRSLADFKEALEKFGPELKNDVIVRAHLDTLYDTMLEQNLCRIIEPYSRVQVFSSLSIFGLGFLMVIYSGGLHIQDHCIANVPGREEVVTDDPR